MSTAPESLSNSQHLSSSVASLNPSKKSSSEISKTYKHASQLYLTRRLSEAYEALQPVIKPPTIANGSLTEDHDEQPLAPIATGSTSQRIKIWSLYATLLNTMVDLGTEDGKLEFGPKQYRDVVRKVQSGEVWDEVVRNGYQGREGSVDAEVVYNLSTLLLGQAQSQSLNQARLENYLSSSSSPPLDLSTQLNESLNGYQKSHNNGTSTPKDLSSRIKILELFTLHVLPRNDEWDYARSFIQNSDILDEERREAFLQTLEELREVKEQEDHGLSESAIEDQSEDETYSTPADPEQPLPTTTDSNPRGHRRTSSEVDYGIEKAHPNGNNVQAPKPTPTISQPQPQSQPPMTKLPPQPEPELSRPSPRSHLSPPSTTPRRPIRKSKAQTQNGAFAQARHLLQALSNLARNMTGMITSNPTVMFQLLIFMLAFLLAFSRKEIRDRVRQIVATSWNKLRSTVGMGVKVSYI